MMWWKLLISKLWGFSTFVIHRLYSYTRRCCGPPLAEELIPVFIIIWWVSQSNRHDLICCKDSANGVKYKIKWLETPILFIFLRVKLLNNRYLSVCDKISINWLLVILFSTKSNFIVYLFCKIYFFISRASKFCPFTLVWIPSRNKSLPNHC